jgi:hypothetical protein
MRPKAECDCGGTTTTMDLVITLPTPYVPGPNQTVSYTVSSLKADATATTSALDGIDAALKTVEGKAAILASSFPLTIAGIQKPVANVTFKLTATLYEANVKSDSAFSVASHTAYADGVGFDFTTPTQVSIELADTKATWVNEGVTSVLGKPSSNLPAIPSWVKWPLPAMYDTWSPVPNTEQYGIKSFEIPATNIVHCSIEFLFRITKTHNGAPTFGSVGNLSFTYDTNLLIFHMNRWTAGVATSICQTPGGFNGKAMGGADVTAALYTWNHIVMCSNGSSFTNGAYFGGWGGGTPQSISIPDNPKLILGCKRSDSPGFSSFCYPFDGEIGLFKMYPRLLTQAEMTERVVLVRSRGYTV